MANEIEMNFKVINKGGLLAFLGNLAREEIARIKMTYLGKGGDDSFYIRIEEISDSGGERKFLTAKGEFKSEKGFNQRKEVSLPIFGEVQEYIEFLKLIGMELRDTKSKIRHKFLIGNLIVTLDEWDVEELGNRVEIEGDNEQKVKDFADQIAEFCNPEPAK